MALKRCSQAFSRPCIEAVGIIEYGLPAGVLPRCPGQKRALLGEVFRYDPGHYLLFTVDLPLIFQVDKATPDEPYLGLRLDSDPSLVASVLMESGIKIKKGDASAKAMDVHSIDANLLDAVVRLVRLTDEPEALTFWGRSS